MSPTEYAHTTDDLAAEFRVVPKTVLRWANELSIGINLGGRAGYRFSDADRARIVESFKKDQPTPRRRRRAA